MINVKDYETFQLAYSALPDSGGTIFVPADTYIWGSDDPGEKGKFRGLHITTKPVVLQGEELGPASALSVIQPHIDHFADADAIFIERLGACVIKNLLFQYPEAMPAGSGRAIKWYVPGNSAGMHGLAIHNVTIENSPNLAVECTCDDHPDNYVGKLEMVGCTISRAKSGGALFLGGAGTNNNTFARCEFNGPGFGGYHNVRGCVVDTASRDVDAADVSSVQMGDEVRGIGMARGTTVDSVDTISTPNSITLNRNPIFSTAAPGTTLTFYRPDGPDAGQLPRGHVHLMRTSISRFNQCSFQGPGDSPAVSTDLVSNYLVLRDCYRETDAPLGGPLSHSFVINGMTNLLINGLYHQSHSDSALLFRTGPLGVAMGRIANASCWRETPRAEA